MLPIEIRSSSEMGYVGIVVVVVVDGASVDVVRASARERQR